MENSLYLIRRTSDGLIAVEVTDTMPMQEAVKSLDDAYARAVVINEDLDMPITEILHKKLAKVFPELTKSRPVERPQPSAEAIRRPIEQEDRQPIVSVQNPQSIQVPSEVGADESESFTVLDSKKQLADFDRARNVYVGGGEVGFTNCTMCQGSKKRNGKPCPMCKGSGDLMVAKSSRS